MQVFSISDLHLSNSVNKPMDIFEGWDNHWETICADWREKVGENDLVLICGDISWASTIEEVKNDILDISALPGKKVIIKGNHDYWWSSLSKVRAMLPPNMFVIQNDSLKIENYIICGTRLWLLPNKNFSTHNQTIYDRELQRLEMSLKNMQAQRTDSDKVIVMTHYPPFDVLFNDSDITRLIENYEADCVIYGHLHGKKIRTKSVCYKGTIPYYITSCDQINHKLIQLF